MQLMQHLVLLLDVSGSMPEAIASYAVQRFLNRQRSEDAENLMLHICEFDHDFKYYLYPQPVLDRPFKHKFRFIGGGTRLYNALARMFHEVPFQHASGVLVIVTDGATSNRMSETVQRQLHALMTSSEWQVFYIGVDVQNWSGCPIQGDAREFDTLTLAKQLDDVSERVIAIRRAFNARATTSLRSLGRRDQPVEA